MNRQNKKYLKLRKASIMFSANLVEKRDHKLYCFHFMLRFNVDYSIYIQEIRQYIAQGYKAFPSNAPLLLHSVRNAIAGRMASSQQHAQLIQLEAELSALQTVQPIMPWGVSHDNTTYRTITNRLFGVDDFHKPSSA